MLSESRTMSASIPKALPCSEVGPALPFATPPYANLLGEEFVNQGEVHPLQSYGQSVVPFLGYAAVDIYRLAAVAEAEAAVAAAAEAPAVEAPVAEAPAAE